MAAMHATRRLVSKHPVAQALLRRLWVLPLGTLPPVQAFCPPVPAFLCVLCLVPSCSWGPTRGLVFDEPAAGGRDRCRSGVCLCEVEIVGKGGGAGFEPMTCSGGVLRFRARCQYCTEAKSEVISNPSPELFGSLLFTTKFGVDNVYSLITALRWYSERKSQRSPRKPAGLAENRQG